MMNKQAHVPLSGPHWVHGGTCRTAEAARRVAVALEQEVARLTELLEAARQEGAQ